jgi:hypothetical protein
VKTGFQEALRHETASEREYLVNEMLKAVARRRVGAWFGHVEPHANERQRN